MKPVRADVRFAPGHADLEWYACERGNGDLVVAVWLAGEAVDDASREHVVDLRVPGFRCTSARAIDTLNGTRHELKVDPASGAVKALRIRDWPLMIELRLAQ